MSCAEQLRRAERAQASLGAAQLRDETGRAEVVAELELIFPTASRARIERERAAARAAQAAGGSGIDMLGQSNAMASFEDGTDTFDFSGLDEYGES